ncbi:MAG: sigma-70 family RNA polymerase sigma factor [Myxococcales bacterium]|nr:sigma-70 family RNA polymerase sigma factor [Myxococcales bacterium]
MLLVEKRELRERFRAGQRAALEEVYRHHVSDVASFLSRGFGFMSRGRQMRFAGFHQPSDLDNAIQETFVRAFKESARLGYDGLQSYKNYLFAIARNYVLDELRAREVAMSPFIEMRGEAAGGDDRYRDGAVEAAGDGPGGSHPVSAENEYLTNELGKLYGRFTESLDDRERLFFQVRFEEQQTQVDAGLRADLSHMQARTLEKKLRARFLKFMHQHGYLDGYGRAKGPALLSGVA